MNRACGATAALMMGLMSHTAAAECVGIAGAMLKEMRAADYVFDAMVMRIDHVGADGTRTRVNHRGYLGELAQPQDKYLREYAATMQVHRVWKGNVPSEITVYFVPNVDGPSFRQGDRRVVFARHQSEEIRRFIDPASPRRETWVQPCSSAPRWDEEKALKQLGPWHRPSRPPADELASKPTVETVVPHPYVGTPFNNRRVAGWRKRLGSFPLRASA